MRLTSGYPKSSAGLPARDAVVVFALDVRFSVPCDLALTLPALLLASATSVGSAYAALAHAINTKMVRTSLHHRVPLLACPAVLRIGSSSLLAPRSSPLANELLPRETTSRSTLLGRPLMRRPNIAVPSRKDIPLKCALRSGEAG